MPLIGDRIRGAREQARLSQEQLGEKLGVSRAAVSQWENNETEPRGKRLQELARVLDKTTGWLVSGGPDMDPADKLAAAPAVAEPDPPYLRSSATYGGPAPDIGGWPRDLPVYGTAIGGPEELGAFEFNVGDTIDHIRRPPRLHGVKNAFAVFTVGESMVPRIRPGGPAIIHPGISPSPGDDVLVELKPQSDGAPHGGLIKRLVSRSETRLRLAQYNPPNDNIIVPMKRVLRVYRIVPHEDLLGF